MSEAISLLKIITVLASVMLSCAIFSRDPGLRINRLMALVPALIGFWALGEFLWNLQSDPVVAASLIRLTTGSWVLLGPACLNIFAELAGDRRPVAKTLVRVSYAVSALTYAIHCLTGWGMVGLISVPWGYQIEFDIYFVFLYANLVVPALYVYANWQAIVSNSVEGDRNRGWSSLSLAVLAVLCIATVTDFILPAFGVAFPPLGSTSAVLVSYLVVYQFMRHGYSLMAPGAFAGEILEALGGGVVVLRANGEIRSANAAFERMVESTRDRVRDTAFSVFAPSLKVDLAWATDAFECDLRTCSGESIPVLISPTRLHNPLGNVRGVALVIRDLRVVADLRGSLLVSDRLATVGGLAASIVEEIREPTHEMRSHLEGMRMQLDCLAEAAFGCESSKELAELVAEREELIEECLEGVDRVDAIVQAVRGFASGTSGPVEAADLNDLVEDALRIAIAPTNSRIAIEKDFEPLSPVLCMPGEIVQVLVNLLVNAFHAIGDGGRVQLSTWQQDSEVWICVEDDGTGILPNVIARIFDPFFTTKPVGHGTGLGLAISHSIVRNHRGSLRVESEPGRGTRFTMVLPIATGIASDRGAVLGDASR